MTLKTFCAKFALVFEYPQDFVLSQWEKDRARVSTLFLVYRFVMFLFVLSNYVANLVHLDYLPYFLIYLTNQGLTLILTEQTLGLCLVAFAYTKQNGVKFYDIAR